MEQFDRDCLNIGNTYSSRTKEKKTDKEWIMRSVAIRNVYFKHKFPLPKKPAPDSRDGV